MPVFVFIIIAVGAYLLGAVPFGLLYAKIRGVDIRSIGSGNIGATNVGRQFGFWGGFVPVFVMDGIKGALPVLIVKLIGVAGFPAGSALADLPIIITGVCAILGHLFPVYLVFKGGKGVSTSAGVFMVIAPIEVSICLGVFLILYLITKEVAIGSIAASIVLPIVTGIIEPHRIYLLILTILASILIIFAHRSNIKKMFSKDKDEKKEATQAKTTNKE